MKEVYKIEYNTPMDCDEFMMMKSSLDYEGFEVIGYSWNVHTCICTLKLRIEKSTIKE